MFLEMFHDVLVQTRSPRTRAFPHRGDERDARHVRRERAPSQRHLDKPGVEQRTRSVIPCERMLVDTSKGVCKQCIN